MPRKRANPEATGYVSESQVQQAIMQALGKCHKVAWCYITTTGTMSRRGKYITIGYPGMSDILGQLTDGRLFAIEVKAPKGAYPVTEPQKDFIVTVVANGGVAGVARSVDDALAIINEQVRE